MTANQSRPVVVVEIDGTPESRHVLRWAVGAARLWDADLDAVITWTPGHVPGWERYDPAVWDPAGSAEKVLSAVVDDVVGADRPARLHAVVAKGHAGALLVERSTGADLLVVGDGGRDGLTGRLLGSTSGHCAAHAACPTVVVHGERIPPAPARASS